MVVRIASGGGVTLVGQFGDGTPFSTAASLHTGNSFPVYGVLYTGGFHARGSLRGPVRMPAQTTRTLAEPDMLDWFKPVRLRDAAYPQGFTLNPSSSFDQ